MALRAAGRHLNQLVPTWVRCASQAKTVFDKLVQVYVIDKNGIRHTVTALEGSSLAEALAEYGAFEAEHFMPHPWDPSNVDCHVYVPEGYLDKLPKLDAEQQQAQQKLIDDFVRAKARDNSRMGYFIKLTPQLSGMTVALSDIEPWQVRSGW
jgi:hypothetical protein